MGGPRVSLDGPGSSGKSTVGGHAARRLGYRFLDTGILYRALTRLSIDRGVDPDDASAIADLVSQLELIEDDSGAMTRVRLGGRPVADERLREEAVDAQVSSFSLHQEVRERLLKTQRDMSDGGNIIVAGRDIGTVVLPDAELKLWLDVSLEVRAARRAGQLGFAADSPDAAEILDALRARDKADSQRQVAPLRKPTDAVVIQADDLTTDETVERFVAAIEAVATPGG